MQLHFYENTHLYVAGLAGVPVPAVLRGKAGRQHGQIARTKGLGDKKTFVADKMDSLESGEYNEKPMNQAEQQTNSALKSPKNPWRHANRSVARLEIRTPGK